MLVTESILRDISRLIIWYPVRWIVRCLSVSSAMKTLNFFGDVHQLLTRNRMGRIKGNLKRGMPNLRQTSSHAVVRTYLRNHYIDRLHIFLYPKLKKQENLDKLVTFEGIEHLRQALSPGRGVVIALGHYGPIQLPLYALGTQGYKIVQVGLPTDRGLSWIGRHVAFKLRLKYESMIPCRILPADTYLRPLFRSLRSGGLVMTTIDFAGGGQWIGRSVTFPFFNHMVHFPLGAASLAKRSGVPLLPLAIQRTADHRYCFRFDTPIYNGSDVINDVEITSYLVQWYEKVIMLDPGLWHFWDEFEPGKLIDAEQ